MTFHFFCNYLLVLQGELCAKYSSWRLCLINKYLTFLNIYYISSVNEKNETLNALFFSLWLMAISPSSFMCELWALPFLSLLKDLNTQSTQAGSTLPPTLISKHRERQLHLQGPDLLRSQRKAPLPLSWDVLWHFQQILSVPC